MLMFSVFIVSSCELIDIDIPDNAIISEKNSKLLLSTNLGFNSIYGDIYVENGKVTSLKIEGKGKEIKSLTWKIDNSNYEGLKVNHSFKSLGEEKVKVEAVFTDGKKEKRDFTVVSVKDISRVDPLQVFTEKNTIGGWDVLFLFSKERLKYATSSTYYYDGVIADWKKQLVPNKNSYVLDKFGEPQQTDDTGMYVGVKIHFSKNGLSNIALIHSGDNWTDLSGSRFVRTENKGLAWFLFQDGVVTPQGSNI